MATTEDNNFLTSIIHTLAGVASIKFVLFHSKDVLWMCKKQDRWGRGELGKEMVLKILFENPVCLD